MSWVELKYSKSEVSRAGKYFSKDHNQRDPEKFEHYFEVLNNWRASHAYPLQSMLNHFRNKSYEVTLKALPVQRLKRSPSIIEKLKREHNMQLDRMEDIGGCRVVLPTLAQVYKVRDSIVDSRTRNILRRQRDYIKKPKESGYRGIHIVYRYNGQKVAYKKHSIELQLRSKVQHAWATAVEVVGTFTGNALKASQGASAWLEFFKLASIAFEDIEYKRLQKNSNTQERKDLIAVIEQLTIIPRLKAFAVSTDHLLKKKHSQSSEYFLLRLDMEKNKVNVKRYPKEHIGLATEQYGQYEKEYSTHPKKDVVLVNAQSISSLHKAYPNYFADTKDFTSHLENIIKLK